VQYIEVIGLQKKLDATCVRKASEQLIPSNKNLHTKMQEAPVENTEEISGCVRQEGVRKGPSAMIAT